METGHRIETLGILGAGRLGMTLAQLAVSAGLRVLIARSGDPAPISRRVRAIGATPATSAEVIDQTDAVVLALPLGRYRSLPADALDGSLVIDAMNYWWASDGVRDDLSDPRTSTSELVQSHLPGARVVKALSHMGYQDLEDEPRPAGDPDRKAIAIAGDEPRDVAVVAALVDDLGFDPVFAGPLAAGIAMEPGAEAFGADVDAASLRGMLEGFADSQRGIVVARARGEAAAAATPRIERVPVESSALRSVGYRADLAVLEIEFVSGDVYRYHAVPASVHDALMDAESHGRFFLDRIRDVYPTTRVS
ncbi:putative dinucleotide-binding enzyme [Microbacterium ginsengiterrae]|uniref:Putative dinucleotide-binding enzyme n=1 Tax=Microbacterium ginsengiterrae TaxID=546115 RepID=A0A7W9C9Q3_9MICO|nr:putative dinucleotide-binding enzyme [Microbacterium ginsengiterrae]